MFDDQVAAFILIEKIIILPRRLVENEKQSSTDYVSNLLNALNNLEVECIVVIGYPDEEKAPYGKDELSKDLVHQERY